MDRHDAVWGFGGQTDVDSDEWRDGVPTRLFFFLDLSQERSQPRTWVPPRSQRETKIIDMITSRPLVWNRCFNSTSTRKTFTRSTKWSIMLRSRNSLRRYASQTQRIGRFSSWCKIVYSLSPFLPVLWNVWSDWKREFNSFYVYLASYYGTT